MAAEAALEEAEGLLAAGSAPAAGVVPLLAGALVGAEVVPPAHPLASSAIAINSVTAISGKRRTLLEGCCLVIAFSPCVGFWSRSGVARW
jgi:hypothetical protein